MTVLRRQSITLYAGFGLCVVVFTYWLFRSFFHVPHDFSNSYFGAYFFLRGRFDTNIFDPLTFNRMIYDEGFRQVFVSYCPNPPFTALFFIPFAWLPLAVAKLAFNAITFVFFLLSLYRLCRFANLNPAWVLMAVPIVFFIPIRNQVLFGQTYFLLFGLMVEGYLAYERKSGWLMAVLWGLAIFLKVFPVIVFLFLILRRDWGPVIKLAIFCIALLAVSMMAQGIHVWETYLRDVLPANGRGEISGAYVVNYQSLLMLLKYAFVGDATLNPSPLLDSTVAFFVSLIVFKAMLLTWCVQVVLKENTLLSFGMLIFTGILLSPYGSTYTYILLIPLAIAACSAFGKGGLVWIVVLIFLIANLPLGLFKDLPIMLQFPRLALSACLFIGVIFLTRLEFEWPIFAAAVSILFISWLLEPSKPNDASMPLIAKDMHSLVFDYGDEKGTLFYKYWTELGEDSEYTSIPVDTLTQLQLVNNQIVYDGKQITNTPDRKLKPSLLNGDRVIYLSDKNNGMGFYNLRVIDLNNNIK
jgi:Glycosyltransferase family 87